MACNRIPAFARSQRLATIEELTASAKQFLHEGTVLRFMEIVVEFGRHVAQSETTWAALRGVAEELSPLVCAQQTKLQGWTAALSWASVSDEPDACDVVERRSELELARTWFRDTPAGELFDHIQTDSYDDAQYKALAIEYFMEAPPWAPMSHTWWVRRLPSRAPGATPPMDEAATADSRPPRWISIPAGTIRTGLTADEAAQLAAACADATMRWVLSGNDPKVSATDIACAEWRGGNASYLEPLLRAAFPVAEHSYAAFSIRSTPVTNAEYAAYVEATGARRPATLDIGPHAANHAVRGVSHDEAETYARWAGAALPTEHEWERAARGPKNHLFPWGDELGDHRAWMMTHNWAVGSNPELTSTEGIDDLLTEFWEWTSSSITADPTALAALAELYYVIDSRGWVVRGGSGAQVAPCSVATTGVSRGAYAIDTQFRLVRR